MKKKTLAVVAMTATLTAALALSPFEVKVIPITAKASTSSPVVYVNTVPLGFTTGKPFIENNRTFVPLRFVSEALKGDVGWSNNTATVNRNGKNILMKIGSTHPSVDGTAKTIDAPARLSKDSRTMVPLRFVSETLGAEVNYVKSENAVYINDSTVPKPEASYKEYSAVDYFKTHKEPYDGCFYLPGSTVRETASPVMIDASGKTTSIYSVDVNYPRLDVVVKLANPHYFPSVDIVKKDGTAFCTGIAEEYSEGLIKDLPDGKKLFRYPLYTAAGTCNASEIDTIYFACGDKIWVYTGAKQ